MKLPSTIGLLVALLTAPAFAGPKAPPALATPAPEPVATPVAERPWAAGVTQAQQDEAFRVYRLGNELFEQSNHAQALVRYREALRAWDHPAIRFNTAVALINLDQPLLAYENLEAALRYGELPFNAETWRQALLYKKLLGGQLSELEVSCDEPGAEVSLDGVPLFIAPGRAARRLRPGAHQLVAAKPGFTTTASALQLAAGGQHHEVVKLSVPSVAQVKLVRRWPTWVPWTVLAGGAVVALAGAPLMASAQARYASYDADLARLCPVGCRVSSLPGAVLDVRSAGRAENIAAIAFFAAGSALAVTGVVMVVLNTPRPEEQGPQVSIAPVFAPGFGGLVGHLRF